jgi:hypothetical protein
MSISRGLATVVTGLQDLGAKVDLVSGIAPPSLRDLDTSVSAGQQGKNVQGLPNDLEQFASYSPLWTMSALTPQQFNDPRSYRNSPADLRHVVFSSAGRFDEQRVNTLYGAPEYYVNNFVMQAVIASSQKTGNSNAIKFTFDIYEPYSMGLFLQSLQIAALEARHPNYLQAPYVFRLDFLGFKDDGTIFSGIKPKFFTCKLVKVTFETTETGSNYKVEAIPYNHQAFGETVNTIPTDIAIEADKDSTGITVKQLLVQGEKSLCAALNRIQEDLILDEKQLLADEYVVEFPERYDQIINTASIEKNNGATINPQASQPRIVGNPSISLGEFGENQIGAADMGITAGTGGNFTFRREGDVYNSATGKIQRNQMIIDPKNRKFQFSPGQPITNVITQMILSSDYANKALATKPTAEGFINWFKIDIQIQLLGFDDKRGDFAKKYIFRVVPYKIHVSIFSSPSAVPPGYAELEKLIAKRYEYIYSGQNNDVLRFDIKIDNTFYAGANPRSEKDSGSNTNVDGKGVEEETPVQTKTNKGASGTAALAATTGGRKVSPDYRALDEQGSPLGQETTQQLVAKSFHRAFLNNSADLISVDLEILGDPYWMVDSGISNYFAPPSIENELTTGDGTMNYEGSDVYIYLSFKTPRDINEEAGLYEFPDDGRESPFSGIYKVVQCENSFSDGTFKQKLRCIRMPLQAADFNNEKQPITQDSTLLVKIGPNAPPKVSVYDPNELLGPF